MVEQTQNDSEEIAKREGEFLGWRRPYEALASLFGLEVKRHLDARYDTMRVTIACRRCCLEYCWIRSRYTTDRVTRREFKNRSKECIEFFGCPVGTDCFSIYPYVPAGWSIGSDKWLRFRSGRRKYRLPLVYVGAGSFFLVHFVLDGSIDGSNDCYFYENHVYTI